MAGEGGVVVSDEAGGAEERCEEGVDIELIR